MSGLASNRAYWVKDAVMKDDISRTAGGMAAENISIIRNIAINLFRTQVTLPLNMLLSCVLVISKNFVV
jgi:hypothetical protein